MKAAGRAAALGIALAMSLSGCGSLYDAPLPGGADLGPDPYRITAQFPDVLDLVPQSSVRVDDVPVGRVERIGLAADGKTALVTMLVNGSVRLPGNAAAKLRQSSLLGEKFVELSEPVAEQPRGRLGDRAVIPVARTNRNSEVEEVLGALSMLLSGGNVAQLNDIVVELNSAMAGNEAQLRSLLSNVEKLTADLDRQRGDITHAIDALDRLSATFAAQQGDIANALDGLGPGLRVVNQQRDQLVTMLVELGKLSDVAVDAVGKSKDRMVADLRLLTPVLRKLEQAGADLPNSLNFLVTYPFPPDAVNTLRGDYFNADLHIDIDLSTIVNNLIAAQPPPGTPPPDAQNAPALPIPQPPAEPKRAPPPRPVGPGGLLDSIFGGR